jgi:hypothetical protein
MAADGQEWKSCGQYADSRSPPEGDRVRTEECLDMLVALNVTCSTRARSTSRVREVLGEDVHAAVARWCQHLLAECIREPVADCGESVTTWCSSPGCPEAWRRRAAVEHALGGRHSYATDRELAVCNHKAQSCVTLVEQVAADATRR